MMAQKKKSLKRKHEVLKSASAKVSMLPAAEEAPDFPRGGANVLSRSEVDEARAEVDALFEREGQKQPHSRKRKKTTKPSLNAFEHEGDPLFQIGISGKLPKFVNTLRFKNLSTGMKLWGVITGVNAKDLIVSLPGGLRGVVTADEASDLLFESHAIKKNTDQDVLRKKTLRRKESKNGFERMVLDDLFIVGQLVPCVVCKLEHAEESASVSHSKRIWLSLRLSLLHKGLTIDSVQDETVMMACVKSIEDHGYILSFGVPSLSGFLPHNKDGSNVSKLKKGQLVQGLVSNIDRTRGVISMKNDPILVANNMIKDYKGLSVDLLVPGTMVNARVQAILHNGLLLSFLTYFTGMVDIFHLQDPFPNSKWQEKFSENTRLKARILYVDPRTKAVGLTLNPHLIQNKAPPLGVKVGEIFEDARVVRIDRGIGLLVELPSKPAPTPGYINISEASDDNIQKLEKKFKEGGKVRTRVMGFRFIEGIAAATLKASLLEQAVFNHSDVKPGLVVKGKVFKMAEFGAIVELSNGLKALCPVPHMSEFDVAKPSKKFKVGAKLLFRVLGCKSKRITVTHKKTMVMSKLKVIASYEDAVEGLIAHGWITGIGRHGCFVKFYNGVSGLAHRTELGIDPGTEAESTFHVGQVVRCRVIRTVPKLQRLELSFIISSDRSNAGHDKAIDIKLGSIVSGVVKNVTTSAVILDLPMDKGSIKGTIFNEQLSDNPGHSEQIKSLLKPGIKFDRVLVLDIVNQNLILSAKYSLIEFARLLPSDIVQIHPQSILQGYICNIIDNGVFVRFLGRLTGFVPKHQVLDHFNEDLLKYFYIGQSVRCQILKVNEETGKIGLSLKQSACFSTDASLIQGYFLEEDMISKLQASESTSSDIKWAEDFEIGSYVEGEVQEIKEYGVIVNLKEYKDIVGFITHHQLGGVSVEIGKVVQARILDIVKSDGIVDLSIRPDLLQHGKLQEAKGKPFPKKRHKSEQHACLMLHQKVDAVVELIKDDYLVLSLPEQENSIAFASTHDYNMWMDPHKHYATGQRINATVQSLPDASKSGRLLLLLCYLSDLKAISESKRAKRESHPKGDSARDLSAISDSKCVRRAECLRVGTLNEPSNFADSKQIERESNYDVGSVVEAEVSEIKPLEMLLKFGVGRCGRIHITELNCKFKEGSPFSQFKIGQKLMASVIEGPRIFGKRDEYLWDLAFSPLAHTGNGVDAKLGSVPASRNFTTGDTVTAFVEKIKKDWVWFVVSRHIRGRMFILDSSSEPSELNSFQKRFRAGMAIVCHISNVDKKTGILDLTLHKLSSHHERTHGDAKAHVQSDCSTDLKNGKVVNAIHEGDILGGRIAKIFPGIGGISVQIGAHIYGRVHFTELIDAFTEVPLVGYKHHCNSGLMANNLELRSMNTELVQCNSPAKIKPPTSPTCEEETTWHGGEKIQPKEKLSVMWEELEHEIEKESPIIPKRTPSGLFTKRVNSASSLRSSMDHSPSCSQNPSQYQHTPLHPGRGNPIPHEMESNTGVSCNRCRPTFMNKESPAVIPLTELQDMIGLPHKHPNNNGNGLLKSWFFLKTKKRTPKKLISTDTDKIAAHSSSPAIMSIEGLKQKLAQARIRRDVAITEVVQLRSSMEELEKKLSKLELHCNDLKHAMKQTVQDGSATGPERPIHEIGIKTLNSRPVTYETMVKYFLQVVAEARVAVRQLCRNLVMSMQDNDGKGLENLSSLLQPFEVHVGPRISRGVMYHLEALMNQAFYEDFESCNFQKNGTQTVLDPYESCAMNFRSFNTLRNLSWDEVLSKGTKFFSEGFSRFCDQKMGFIVSMLSWTSAWPEQLLQAFFTAAKCVWLVHLLAFSFHPPLLIFRVERPTNFDSVYMEDILADRQTKQATATVRIMVMPGFYVHNSVIKCKVLCRYRILCSQQCN